MKKELRKRIIKLRETLDLAENDSKIIDKLVKMVENYKYDTILSYMPIKKEVDTRYINDMLSKNYKIYIPKVLDRLDMEFYLYKKDMLRKSKFGILEPTTKEKAIYSKALAIIPLVGFDEDLNRLGYGAGYYDRYFINKKNVIKIGIAYEIQHIDIIFGEANDICLDYVITEDKVYINRDVKKNSLTKL